MACLVEAAPPAEAQKAFEVEAPCYWRAGFLVVVLKSTGANISQNMQDSPTCQPDRPPLPTCPCLRYGATGLDVGRNWGILAGQGHFKSNACCTRYQLCSSEVETSLLLHSVLR